MTDVFSPEKRSRIMAKVRGKNTKPELTVRSLLHRMGHRFRLHVSKLPGKPDIVLPRHKKIVEVRGCFWHGHVHCKRSSLPDTNRPFWEQKITRNKERDENNLAELERMGWEVLVVWECEAGKHAVLVEKLERFMETNKMSDRDLSASGGERDAATS